MLVLSTTDNYYVIPKFTKKYVEYFVNFSKLHWESKLVAQLIRLRFSMIDIARRRILKPLHRQISVLTTDIS